MIGTLKSNNSYHGILRVLTILTWFVFFSFIATSLYFIISMSVGYFPILGHEHITWHYWQHNLSDPQIINAAMRSFITAICATIASLLMAMVISAYLAHRQYQQKSHKIMLMISGIIAIPHQAFAIAMLFLLMPSGMMMRIIVQMIGDNTPISSFILPDAYGVFYIYLLMMKESCFLLLMIHATSNRYQYQQYFMSAVSLGYHPITAYMRFIFPHIYKKLRLAIFIVLIYSIANVDIAYFTMVATKPTLSQLIIEFWHHPNLDKKLDASVCVLILFLLSLCAIFCWRLGEILWQYVNIKILIKAQRQFALSWVRFLAIIALFILCLIIMALLTMVIWAFAGYWRFPDILPQSFSLYHWQQYQDALLPALGNSIMIAVISSVIAIILLLCHYHVFMQSKYQSSSSREHIPYWILTSLLIPQTCLLFGGMGILYILDMNQSYIAMIILQLLTVIPYIFLCLYLPFAHFSPMLMMTGLALGKSPWVIFWRVILPILSPAILIAFAIGCAVAISDYLPVFFGGGGRYHSLSSLTIAMMNSADYRAVGMVAILLTMIPIMIFLTALILPRLIFKNRQLMLSKL